jgi:hypothetical protein
MRGRLLPPASEFVYTGSRYAAWLAGLVVALKMAIALGAIFNGHYAASTADGIPLDTYTPAGAQAVVGLFGNLGLSQLLLGLVGVVVIVRYRPLLPAYLVLLLAEHAGRKLLALATPIPRVGGSGGGLVTWTLIGLLLLALVLSLRPSAR